MEKEEKWIQYAAKISGAIGELLENEDSEYQIDKEELLQGDNLTEFFHALANVAPAHIFNKFTGSDKNYLEFNHIANQLCFQYSNREK